jgi:hypothetical protein
VRMKRLLFSFFLLIFIGSLSTAHAKNKFCKKLVITAAAILSGCAIQGCATSLPHDRKDMKPDMVMPDHLQAEGYFQEAGLIEIKKEFEKRLAGHNYKWVLEIGFLPNDFAGRSDKKIGAPKSVIDSMPKGAPIKQDFDSSDLDIWSFKTSEDSDGFIGKIQFRFNGARHAINTIDRLIVDPKKNLPEILLITTGGSHGASEIQNFNEMLKAKYGKEVDVIIIGDGIQQPLTNSMQKFRGLPANAVAINFYQQNTFLSGAPIENFLNIKSSEKKEFHGGIAEVPEKIAESLMGRISLEPSGPKIHISFTTYDVEKFQLRTKELNENRSLVHSYISDPEVEKALAASYEFMSFPFKEAEPFLEIALRHPDYRVREKAYGYIANLSSDKRLNYFNRNSIDRFEKFGMIPVRGPFSDEEIDYLISMTSYGYKHIFEYHFFALDHGKESSTPDKFIEALSQGGLLMVDKLGKFLKEHPDAFKFNITEEGGYSDLSIDIVREILEAFKLAENVGVPLEIRRAHAERIADILLLNKSYHSYSYALAAKGLKMTNPYKDMQAVLDYYYDDSDAKRPEAREACIKSFLAGPPPLKKSE